MVRAPKDCTPMFRVYGPLTNGEVLFRDGKLPQCHYRSRALAERQAARLNARVPGHRVIEGVGGRSGWRRSTS